MFDWILTKERGLLGFTGLTVRMLEQLVSEVYMPMLSSQLKNAQQRNEISDFDDATDSAGFTEDFLGSVGKFAAHMRQTIRNLEGDLHLDLPDVDPDLLKDTQVSHNSMCLVGRLLGVCWASPTKHCQ